MKIRDRLEAKVLAGDAEKLALASQLSLGDIWLILGAHRLPVSTQQNVPVASHPSRKAGWGSPSPFPVSDPRAMHHLGWLGEHTSAPDQLFLASESQIHWHPNQSGGGGTTTLLFCKKLWHFVSVCVCGISLRKTISPEKGNYSGLFVSF